MAHAEFQITINRSVQDVFNYLLDGDNNPQWRPVCLDVQRLTNKPDAVGAKFKQGSKSPGGRIDCDYEITECEPNQSIKFQVIAGPARPTGVYKFVSAGNATTVTFALNLETQGLQKLVDGIIQKYMQSEVAYLINLKNVLETRA